MEARKDTDRTQAGASGDTLSLEERVAVLEQRLGAAESTAPRAASVAALAAGAPGQTDRLSMLIFSADLDHLLAAMTLASSARVMGAEVRLFFAFWGCAALRRPERRPARSWWGRMMGWMLPRGLGQLKLSRMNMGGIGTCMMRWRMQQRNVPALEEMLDNARELGVRIYVCDTSLDLMGLTVDDLIDYPGLAACGAATFLSDAMGGTTLFI